MCRAIFFCFCEFVHRETDFFLGSIRYFEKMDLGTRNDRTEMRFEKMLRWSGGGRWCYIRSLLHCVVLLIFCLEKN